MNSFKIKRLALLLLFLPFGWICIAFKYNKKSIAALLLCAGVIFSLYLPQIFPGKPTEISAKSITYDNNYIPTESATSTAEEVTTTTTTATTAKDSDTTKTKKNSKAKTKTAKKTTTVTTARLPKIYLTDDSEVYTNMSYTAMHTSASCSELNGTIVIMTFKQSCELCIPYCECCAYTVIYEPPEENSEPELEDWELEIIEKARQNAQ